MPDSLSAGGNGTDGKLTILGADGKPVVDAQVVARPIGSIKDTQVTLGGKDRSGLLNFTGADGFRSITVEGRNASLSMGGKQRGAERGHNASISLYNRDNGNPININAGSDAADVFIGEQNIPGRVTVYDGSNPNASITLDGKANALRFSRPGHPSDARVEIRGQQGAVRAGGDGVSGTVSVFGADNTARVELRGQQATVRVGGNGVEGTVSVLGADGMPLLELLGRKDEAVLGLGQKNRPARLSLYDANQREAVRLDAKAGDIMLTNADCAEEFDVSPDAKPGMVMVMADDGTLMPSEKAYDTRVAGVVSGAGSYRPGLILDRRDTGHRREPIALMGKVYVYAEASESPIAVGDLLTTSGYAGHAMRIDDRDRALGAVLGKALAPLRSGRKLIPILVTLQ